MPTQFTQWLTPQGQRTTEFVNRSEGIDSRNGPCRANSASVVPQVEFIWNQLVSVANGTQLGGLPGTPTGFDDRTESPDMRLDGVDRVGVMSLRVYAIDQRRHCYEGTSVGSQHCNNQVPLGAADCDIGAVYFETKTAQNTDTQISQLTLRSRPSSRQDLPMSVKSQSIGRSSPQLQTNKVNGVARSTPEI